MHLTLALISDSLASDSLHSPLEQVAGVERVELSRSESKSDVLPIDYTPILIHKAVHLTPFTTAALFG